jgi:cation:H+ antiporter
MSIVLSLGLLVLGFAFLIKGADYLIDGSVSLAKRFKVSDLVIGLTIVSFGTSAPELIVSSVAAWNGKGDLSIGNVVGSNIANLMLILGVSAIIRPLIVKKNTAHKEIPFSFLAAITLFILGNDILFGGGIANVLTRGDGLILICFFAIFLFYSFATAKSEEGVIEDAKEESAESKAHGLPLTWLMVGGGLVALSLGGRWVVSGATEIAMAIGMSEKLIGLTIVAIGTSLPELFASVMAARKGNSDIAIGNVVGSNIFNVFWILGAASLIKPLNFNSAMNFDIVYLLAITALMPVLIYVGKKRVLDKGEGVFLSLAYFSYIIYLVFRG